MVQGPLIGPGLAGRLLPTLLPRPLGWGLFLGLLGAGLAGLSQPARWVRSFMPGWAPLPRYTLQLRGGDTCLRCPAAHQPALTATGEPRLAVRLDAPLDLLLDPAQPVAGPVFVYAFLRHQGQTSRWPILMERAADDTLRLQGLARDLLDLPATARATYELILVVQRSPLPPSYAVIPPGPARSDPSSDPQVLRGEVELLGPALRHP